MKTSLIKSKEKKGGIRSADSEGRTINDSSNLDIGDTSVHVCLSNMLRINESGVALSNEICYEA